MNVDEEQNLDVDADLLEQQDGVAEVTPEVTPEAKPDEMKTALAELAEHVKKVTAPKEEPAAPMSEEQKAEMWGVWDPTKTDKDFFRKFLRLNTDMDPAEVEKAVKEFQPLFAEMQKGLVRQAVVGARNLTMMELEKFREELNPDLAYIRSSKAESTRTRFFSSYESLKDPKFEKVINGVARGLANQTFTDEAAYFKALAEGAADTIKAVLPDFVLGAGKTTTTPTKAPKLPRTSAGGTGGAGGGARQPAEQTADAASSVLD